MGGGGGFYPGESGAGHTGVTSGHEVDALPLNHRGGLRN